MNKTRINLYVKGIIFVMSTRFSQASRVEHIPCTLHVPCDINYLTFARAEIQIQKSRLSFQFSIEF